MSEDAHDSNNREVKTCFKLLGKTDAGNEIRCALPLHHDFECSPEEKNHVQHIPREDLLEGRIPVAKPLRWSEEVMRRVKLTANCEKCGAIIANEKLHEAWHEAMGK